MSVASENFYNVTNSNNANASVVSKGQQVPIYNVYGFSVIKLRHA